LVGGIINGNHAQNGNGGGVNLNKGLSVSGGAQFYGNTAGDSGGAITQWNSGQAVSISGSAFDTNTAKNNGGAVFVNESFLTLTNSTFTSNTVDSGSTANTYGGGVYAGGGWTAAA